jgi:hypothetical protein
VQNAGLEWNPDEEHTRLARQFRECVDAGDSAKAGDLVLQAALRRRFLG